MSLALTFQLKFAMKNRPYRENSSDDSHPGIYTTDLDLTRTYAPVISYPLPIVWDVKIFKTRKRKRVDTRTMQSFSFEVLSQHQKKTLHSEQPAPEVNDRSILVSLSTPITTQHLTDSVLQYNIQCLTYPIILTVFRTCINSIGL